MMHARSLIWMVVAGCGSSAAPAREAAPVPVAPPDAAPVDAGVPEEVANAPAWIFRFNVPGRLETWTLRHHGGVATMVVQAATGTTRYLGTATDGMALVLTAGSLRLALECKREQLAVGATCLDPRPPQLDVLACYHPDFKSPMPFGPAPGVEYVVGDRCSGYQRIAGE